MTKPFFARWYLAIFILMVFLLPFITRGTRLAIEGNVNDVRDWLPPSYPESKQLVWFQKHFAGEQFALVSWKGCTLGNTEKLNLLVAKLVPRDDDAPRTDRTRLFAQVVTGPQMLGELTGPPLNLDYREAIRRLEGALVGPRQDGQGDASRTTCLIVTLSEEGKRTNRAKRHALEEIKKAAAECAIAPESLHMGGPPVDNVAIDVEGERTLYRLAVLSFVVGLGLSYWCFRSLLLTAMVFTIGVISAGVSLGMVYYFGLAERHILGLAAARFGTVDAILMSMPAVVYVLGLSGAIHIVNYYRDARAETGLAGAPEQAIRHAWIPCTLAAITTALGLASLFTSDIMPIRKFGLFAAIGVVATLVLLFTLLPAMLYRFPPALLAAPGRKQDRPEETEAMHPLLWRVAHFIIRRNRWVCAGWVAVMVVFACGLPYIESSVQLLKLFHKDADIIHDYRWLEANLGNLVPMELVLRIEPSACRSGTEAPEGDGGHYRLTLLERLEMTERVQARMEGLDQVGRALSVSTFAPPLGRSGVYIRDIGQRYAINAKLEEHYEDLRKSDYLREEQFDQHAQPLAAGQPHAQLWRISARVGALENPKTGKGGIDYGEFVSELREAVEPVLDAYRQRDRITQALHRRGEKIRRSRIYLLVSGNDLSKEPSDDGAAAAKRAKAAADRMVTTALLRQLLREAGAKVRAIDWSKLPRDTQGRPVANEKVRAALAGQDCLVVAMPSGLFDGRFLGPDGPLVFSPARSREEAPDDVISAKYTGVVPLVYKTQRQLLVSLRQSIAWAFVLIAIVMMFVLRSVSAGLISMAPNIFPVILVFGAMGWAGIKVDIGMMLTASVALGVAVDDTVHFLFWFQRAMREGHDRQSATLYAYRRCAKAMLQTTVIAGLGLAMFVFSTFTPTRQFGYMMVTLLAAALVGDLLMLPAILAGPVGRFFCDRLQRHADPAELPQRLDQPAGPRGHVREDRAHRAVRASYSSRK